jgi:rubrerythrin
MATTESRKISDLLKQQIAVETRTLETVKKEEDSSKEAAVKLVFMDVRMDTAKHAEFLRGIVDMLEETPCDQWSAKVQRYVDRVKLQRKLKEIVAEEDNMTDLVSKALKLTKDPIAQLLLSHLKEDEQKHSKNLNEIARLIQMSPLQSKKGQKGTDIVCATDE